MIASVSANPSHIMPWSWPRSSGWRPTASIVLPKMKPTPTPGPMEPRPVARPSSSALAASTVDVFAMGLLLVVGVDRSTDVDGGKRGEDECLKAGDQGDLEQVDGHPDGHAEEQLDRPIDHARCEDAGERQEHGDHEVPCQQIGEESHRQR